MHAIMEWLQVICQHRTHPPVCSWVLLCAPAAHLLSAASVQLPACPSSSACSPGMPSTLRYVLVLTIPYTCPACTVPCNTDLHSRPLAGLAGVHHLNYSTGYGYMRTHVQGARTEGLGAGSLRLRCKSGLLRATAHQSSHRSALVTRRSTETLWPTPGSCLAVKPGSFHREVELGCACGVAAGPAERSSPRTAAASGTA